MPGGLDEGWEVAARIAPADDVAAIVGGRLQNASRNVDRGMPQCVSYPFVSRKYSMNKCMQPNNAFFTARLRRAVAVGGIGKTVSSDTIRLRLKGTSAFTAQTLALWNGWPLQTRSTAAVRSDNRYR